MKAAVTVRDRLRRAVGFAAGGAVLAYALAEESPEFFLLMTVGLIAAWRRAVLPNRPARPRVITAGLVGVLGAGSLQLIRLGFTVSAFAYFIGLLLIVKLFDLRRARDWGQALILITGLYVSAVLTSNSLATGLILMVGSVLMLRAVFRHQIHAVADAAGLADAIPACRHDRDLRSLQIGAGFAIAVIASLAFLFLPRNIGSDAFGNWGAVRLGQVTGFTDEVDLGGAGLISQSATPVLDVTLLDREGRNRGRVDSPPIYLRGAVLEDYHEGRWRRDPTPRARSLVRAQYIPQGVLIRPWLSPRREIWETELRITVRGAPAGTSPVFTLWQPLELRPVGAGQFFAHDAENGVVLREGSAGRVEYVVRALDPRFKPFEPDPDQPRKQSEPFEVPPGVAEYARGVLNNLGIEPDPAQRPVQDDVRAVRALENHLQSNFTYTLVDEPVPRGRDPTEWFLHDRRTGHCEYYASALALMARSIGINARVITGYVASDYNEVTGQYLVRESNAHGWIEAEVAPDLWMTFDGTPPMDLHQIHQPTPTLWRSVKMLYETAEYAWTSAVIGFDVDAQRRLLGDFATDFGLRSFGTRMIERMRDGGRGLVARAAIAAGAVFVTSMAIGLLLVHRREFITRWTAAFAGLSRRFLRRARRGAPAWPERLHRQVLRALARAGRPKPPGLPLRSHLSEVSRSVPGPLASALDEACDLLYRARFAPDGSAPERDFRRVSRTLRRSENARPTAPSA